MSGVVIRSLDPRKANDVALVANRLTDFMVPRFLPSYPGFVAWLARKLYPGFVLGQRRVVCALWRGTIVGVAVAKYSTHSEGDQKLCSMYVEESFRGVGVGSQVLMELAAPAEGPLAQSCVVTVPEEQLAYADGKRFERFLGMWGFELIDETKGRYRKNKVEVVYRCANFTRRTIEDTH